MSDTPEPHDDLAGLTGLYALDALDGDQREQFEAYLDANPDARAEVAEFRATAALLDAVVAEAPPAGLRDRVLAEVANIRQESPIVDLAARRDARQGRFARLAMVAAMVIIAALGGVLIGRNTFGAPNGQRGELAGVLDHADARVVALHGDGPGNANVVWSAAAGKAVVVGSDMPQVPDDQTLELWRIDGDTASPIGTFAVAADRSVKTTFATDLRGATALGVTVEPRGGSSKPTTPVVMSAELS